VIDEYDEQLDQLENYDNFLNQSDSHINEIHSIKNDIPQPISRPPTKYRDISYGIAFILHFILILSLSFAEQMSLQHAALSYNRAGSEASIVMIVTLLGGTFGAILFMIIVNSPYKEEIFQYSLVAAIIIKICIANILFIMRSLYSFIGIFFLFAAFWDYLRYRLVKQSIPFTITLVELVTELLQVYGLRLVIVCGLIVAAQICVLLWWGAFFVGLVATMPLKFLFPIIFIMFFSFYWITQFFHMMISFVIGGSILRLFIDDEHSASAAVTNSSSLPASHAPPTILKSMSSDTTTTSSSNYRPTIQQSKQMYQNQIENMKNRVYLYFQCSLTTSFGSLSKGALLITPSYFFFLYKYSFLKLLSESYSIPCISCVKCLMKPMNWIGLWIYDHYLFYYHKLSLPLLAIYGKTFNKTTEFYYYHHPETLLISVEEYSFLLFNSCNTVLSGIFAVLFALLSESKQESTWPLFLVICYVLFYSGISLSCLILSSAIDALIIASVINPEKVSKKNQLVCLRFLRLSEVELR
jgi:uncharacterized membrane protein YsdA (DUF1294 family)